MERHAAQAALTWIRDDMTIGLGSGKAVDYLIEFISMGEYPNLKVVTNQLSTALKAKSRNLNLTPAALVDHLDYTFDSVDYAIKDLSAVKLNTTVICQDQVLANMANEVIYMVDSRNFHEVLEDKLPVEVEVVNEALSFAGAQLEKMGAQVYMENPERQQPVVSSSGHYIIEAIFPHAKDLRELNRAIMAIPGVIATTIYDHKNVTALVYDKDTVQTITAE